MDGDAIKSFFAHHVEKFVLGLIAAIAIFLIYSGTKYPDYLTKTQPERLQEDARTVKQSIDDDHTEAIAETLPAKEGEDYPERVLDLQKPIPYPNYGEPVFKPASGDSSMPRQDPQLFAPVDLRVQGVLGALAMKNPRGRTSYPAMELEDADPVEVEEEPKPRSSRRTGRRGRNMEGGGYGGGGEMAGEAYGEMGGEGYGGEMGGYGGEMGGYGGEMGGYGGAGGKRRLNAKYNEGYKPTTTGAGMTGGMAATAGETPLKTIPQSSIFIAGTAAVPHKQLIESYKSALLDAAGYQAQRDRPIYAGFEVQRAEVTGRSADQLEEDDWVLVGDWEQHNKIALYQWDGFGAEIVPGDYRDPRLTAVIPPLLIYDFTRFVTHPLIPLKSLQEIAAEKQPQRRAPTAIEGPILPGRGNDNNAAAPPAAGNRLDVGAMVGGMGPGGMGTAMGPGGMGPGGMGFGGQGRSVAEPDYKLVRFYDFRYNKDNGPQPGREYVYRVRIGLEDPNFPKSPRAQPTLRNLAEDVFARVAPKVAEFEASRERDFVIYSDWSDPSPVASLPDFTEVYAGPVQPASTRSLQVSGKSIDYVNTPPQGKAVGMRWDWTLAANVPAEMEVMPGTVLNTKQAAEVIDPLTMAIKKIEERQIETNVTVVDVSGGELLQITEESDEEQEMTAPGTMLMFDANGGLYVRDDIDDLRAYRMHTFADEREAAKPAPTSGDDGYPGGYGEEMGGFPGGYGN